MSDITPATAVYADGSIPEVDVNGIPIMWDRSGE
jgi:hypothetical protein